MRRVRQASGLEVKHLYVALVLDSLLWDERRHCKADTLDLSLFAARTRATKREIVLSKVVLGGRSHSVRENRDRT